MNEDIRVFHEPNAELVVSPSQVFSELAAVLRAEGITIDQLLTPDKNRYLQSLNYGWIYYILHRTGPSTDDRLSREIGAAANALHEAKPHFSTQGLEPFFSGETSSWNFEHRPWVANLWQDIQQRLADLNSSAESMTTTLEQLRNELQTWLEDQLRQQIEIYHHLSGVEPQNLILTGSGAAAILAARNLFGRDKEFVTTLENGGEVIKSAKSENSIRLRNDFPVDGELETNIARSQKEVAEDYIDKITKGARVISFTV